MNVTISCMAAWVISRRVMSPINSLFTGVTTTCYIKVKNSLLGSLPFISHIPLVQLKQKWPIVASIKSLQHFNLPWGGAYSAQESFHKLHKVFKNWKKLFNFCFKFHFRSSSASAEEYLLDLSHPYTRVSYIVVYTYWTVCWTSQ